MVKLLLTSIALLALAQVVAPFDPDLCTGFAFTAKDRDRVLTGTSGSFDTWYCGTLPPQRSFCTQGSATCQPLLNSTEWCNFMIRAVRNQANPIGNGNPRVPELPVNEIPSPNGGPLLMWSCYYTPSVSVGTLSFLVDFENTTSSKNPLEITERCIRNRNLTWVSPPNVNNRAVIPVPLQWQRCYFNHLEFPGYQHRECPSGQYCEFKNKWWSTCLPDPNLDHSCCLAPNGNHCEVGQCCQGYHCKADNVGHRLCVPGKDDDLRYTGICNTTTIAKTNRNLWMRCLTHSNSSDPQRGDCADGYHCIGDSWFATCRPDPAAVTECNMPPWETACRPGDCAKGWFCKQFFNSAGAVSWTQCRAGVEPSGVNDGHCSNPSLARTYNESLAGCTGAICSIWGDPHIVSCDEKKWDCQAEGLFVLMRNFMYEIQAHFTQMRTPSNTSAAITDAVAIQYKNDTDAPKIQLMFPNFVSVNETYDNRTKVMGRCPVLFYVNDLLVNISRVNINGILHNSSGVKVTLAGQDRVVVEYTEKFTKRVSTVQINVGGTGPHSAWGCIFSVSVCLPRGFESQFRNSTRGILGTPNGNYKDDWVARNNSVISYGDNRKAFNFCQDWCVKQDENIMGGWDYATFMCKDQVLIECGPRELELLGMTPDKVHTHCCKGNMQCSPSEGCKLDICATGEAGKNPIVELGNNSTPPVPTVVTDDCSDLGAFVSQATGPQTLTREAYTGVSDCKQANEVGAFNLRGWDASVSVLVGKSYKCMKGNGVEGKMVVNNNFIVDDSGTNGCDSFIYTSRGACVGPLTTPPNTANPTCIHVGGDVKMGTSQNQRVTINDGSEQRMCDLVYAGSCSVGDNSTCPANRFQLADENLLTGGQVTRNPNLNLTSFQKELTILHQKQMYWKDYAPLIGDLKDTGKWELCAAGRVMTLSKSTGNSCIQVFNFPTGWPAGVTTVKFDGLQGKTILINVGGTSNNMTVPYMVDHNNMGNTGPGGFDVSLLMSTVWNFYGGSLTLSSDINAFQGSIVVHGDLYMRAPLQLGRTLVLGNLVQDKEGSTFLNYPFQPQCRLPIPPSICTVEAAPFCTEAFYKNTGTNENVCPNSPPTFKAVEVHSSKGTLPASQSPSIIYNIKMEVTDGGAPHVRFMVDNPFPGLVDIFVKYEKAVGRYALDPACKSAMQVKDCQPEAIEVLAGCVAHGDHDPYTMVSVYFASDSRELTTQGMTTEVDKCCEPPEYLDGMHGVAMVTYKIQCVCPTVENTNGVTQG